MSKLPQDIENLENRINNLKQIITEPEKTQINNQTNANSLIIEFIVTILVSGLFGYFIDQWLNSLPIFLLISLLFGFISGVNQIYKKTKDYV